MADLPSSIQDAFIGRPLSPHSLIERDRILQREAIDFMSTHPGHTGFLGLKKVFFFLFIDPHHEKGRSPAYWLPASILTILAAWGIYLRRKQLNQADGFLLLSLTFALIMAAAVFVVPRYRIVNDPLLIVYASLPLARKFVSEA